MTARTPTTAPLVWRRMFINKKRTGPSPVLAVRCQLPRKGELFALFGQHNESSSRGKPEKTALALRPSPSQALCASSPKGKALGSTIKFPVLPKAPSQTGGVSLEGEDADPAALLSKIIRQLFSLRFFKRRFRGWKSAKVTGNWAECMMYPRFFAQIVGCIGDNLQRERRRFTIKP